MVAVPQIPALPGMTALGIKPASLEPCITYSTSAKRWLVLPNGVQEAGVKYTLYKKREAQAQLTALKGE